MIRNTIEKFKDHREVCYRKENNSGNISMKNNGKDITSLASTFTWNLKGMDSKK